MEKTIICSYWKNKNCKYMDEPSKCSFAHDIINIECKYRNMCYNAHCKFNHGNESTMVNMVYDFPIIVDKRKYSKINKKNKNILKKVCKHNDMKEYIFKSDLPYIEEKENKTIVTINNKNKGIKENVNIFNTGYNKVLSMIDEFYIKKYNNMLYEKNNYISQIVKNNYKNIFYLRTINNDKDSIINKLNSENKSLKKIIEELKKGHEENKNTINNMVNNIKNVTKDDNKLILLYNKYINLYEIFNRYKNYKLINLNEIRKYTNDKNIYKLKQRSTKIYRFYENFKNGDRKSVV